jgi:hypothetical protein
MSGQAALPPSELPFQRNNIQVSLPTITTADTDFYPVFVATEPCHVNGIGLVYSEGTTPAGTVDILKVPNGSDTGDTGDHVSLLDAAINVATPVPSTLVENQLMNLGQGLPDDAASADVSLDILVGDRTKLHLNPGDRLYLKTASLDDIDEAHFSFDILTGAEGLE